MAVTADVVVLELQAKLDAYMANIGKAQTDFDRRIGNMEKRAKIGGSRIAGFFAGFVTVATLRKLQQLADAYTRIQNQLRVAGLEGDDLANTYRDLTALAIKNGASVEALATLYGRATQAAKELGASRADILRFTEGVAAALRVAGTSPEAASGALLQLSQALGSAIVRAEEFNSINEGARPILQAVADGLVEAGGSVSRLRQLVIDGKLTNAAFFDAFEAGSGNLIEQAANTTLTMGQQFENLKTISITAAGDINDAFAISDKVGAVLSAIGEGIARLAEVIKANEGFFKLLKEDFEAIIRLGPEVNGAVSRQAAGAILAMKERAGGADPRLSGQASSAIAGMASRLPPAAPPGPISLTDPKYNPPGTSDGKAAERRAKAWKDETRSIMEATAALSLETEAVGMSNVEADKRRAILELTQAAQRNGIALTPQVLDQINTLSAAYADQNAILTQTVENQQRLEAAQQASFDAIKGGFLDVITKAKSFKEALLDVALQLAKIAASAAFDRLFQPGQGGGSGGIFGSLIGSIGKFFAGGFASGGQIPSGKFGMVGEKGIEFLRGPANVTPLTNAATGPSVQIAQSFDFSGVDPSSVARILSRMDQVKSEAVAASVAAVRAENNRRPSYLRGGK